MRLPTLLLDWYAVHGRALAIRRLADPYAIWLAETMSQQTQIGRVGEALPAFLARFPDVATLAAASVGDLLRAWGGLGYPRRALALREAARELTTRFGSRIPTHVSALETLPGVGPYTARAVASTAFGVPVTALDVNARRVLGRVLGRTDPGASAGRGFQVVADALAPADHAADWNHALMDLGATVCRPTPDCAACPLRALCAWAAQHPPPVVSEPPATRRRHSPPAAIRFRDTNRYVRGRVLASLRDVPPGTWLRIESEALSIAPDRVERAVAQLHQEGLVELDVRRGARLPTS